MTTNRKPADAIWLNGSRYGEGYEQFCLLESDRARLVEALRDWLAQYETGTHTSINAARERARALLREMEEET